MAAPGFDMSNLLALLQELQDQSSSQQAYREASRAKIFKTVKARFAATKECSGNEHTTRHANDALADSDKPLPLPPADLNNIGWVLVDHPFPPCTTGLDNLLSVMLKDLVMGSHHRGKFLLVELVKVIRVGDLETVLGVRDCAGEVERLKINTVCIKVHKTHQWPQSGHWFIVKEPFLTLNERKQTNDPCIRVDHPSDLVDAHRLPDSLLDSKSLHRVLAVVGNRTAALCRQLGNAAFVRGDLVASHDSYTEGLQSVSDDAELQNQIMRQDLHRKRAHI